MKTKTFSELRTEIEKEKEYFNNNPRENYPPTFKEFLEYAKLFYKNRDNVNWTYSEDMEEQMEEVEDYIGDCSEALVLMKEYTLSECEEVFKEMFINWAYGKVSKKEEKEFLSQFNNQQVVKHRKVENSNADEEREGSNRKHRYSVSRHEDCPRPADSSRQMQQAVSKVKFRHLLI